jgi:protein-tyrosine kinase
MEKIKAALAKVKSTRSIPSKNANLTKPAAVKVQKASRDIDNINYTNTNVIKLDAMHLERNRIISHLNHNANASIFDSMRTQILQKMEENNWQTIAVVFANARIWKDARLNQLGNEYCASAAKNSGVSRL